MTAYKHPALTPMWKIPEVQTLVIFIGSLAVLPVIHEFLHYIPAYFLGMNPWFIWSQPAVGYWGGNYWTLLIARHMPELVMVTAALPITYKFRTNPYVLILILPLLFMAIWGFLGHLGVLS